MILMTILLPIVTMMINNYSNNEISKTPSPDLPNQSDSKSLQHITPLKKKTLLSLISQKLSVQEGCRRSCTEDREGRKLKTV